MFNTWLENRILNKLADRLLPLITTSDVGKSPVVTLGEEQGVLILPETTIVKAEGEYPSVSADTSMISVGDKLIVTIGDTTKTLEVLEGELAPYVHFDTDFEISFGDDAITFFVVNMDTGTEFTAEIYKAEAVAEWSLGSGGGGGGGVVIFTIDEDNDNMLMLNDEPATYNSVQNMGNFGIIIDYSNIYYLSEFYEGFIDPEDPSVKDAWGVVFLSSRAADITDATSCTPEYFCFANKTNNLGPDEPVYLQQ